MKDKFIQVRPINHGGHPNQRLALASAVGASDPYFKSHVMRSDVPVWQPIHSELIVALVHAQGRSIPLPLPSAMSFQDIETGLSHPSRTPSSSLPQSREDSAFLGLQNSLSLQVFKINANVQGILKLVDQLGTTKDSASLRKSLHDLTETTREMAKRGGEDLKKLSAMQTLLPHYKTTLQKTSHDFQLSLVAFQRAQQVSAERQRTVVEGVKFAVEEDHAQSSQEVQSSPQQRQAQLLQTQLSPHELAYQESLIQEREAEIREIETGIHELAEIFHDLGTLVHQQGGMLDNIESNISSVAVDTSGAAEELTTAAEYQRKAGRRAACLMLVLVVVVAIVLLAILS